MSTICLSDHCCLTNHHKHTRSPSVFLPLKCERITKLSWCKCKHSWPKILFIPPFAVFGLWRTNPSCQNGEVTLQTPKRMSKSRLRLLMPNNERQKKRKADDMWLRLFCNRFSKTRTMDEHKSTGEREATLAAKHFTSGFYMGDEKLNWIPDFPLSCSACFRM